MRKLWIVFSLTLAFITGCQADHEIKDTVVLDVAAAISLQEALLEIKSLYEKSQADVEIQFHFGGSGTLARQIEQGFAVDVFISADESWMEMLKKQEKILLDTELPIVRNRLVLVSKDKNFATYGDLFEVDWRASGQIALGNPATVPAGNYAKEALDALGVWEDVEENLIFAKDVRQVLAYMESGNVDYGFVYASDAGMLEDVYVLPVEAGLHQEIIYPGAVVNGSEIVEVAKGFIEFMQTDEAQEVFDSYGFIRGGGGS